MAIDTIKFVLDSHFFEGDQRFVSILEELYLRDGHVELSFAKPFLLAVDAAFDSLIRKHGLRHSINITYLITQPPISESEEAL